MAKSSHYIDNKRFEVIIRAYRDGDTSVEDELMGMLDLLITNIISSFNFKVDIEDAKQECFLLILKTLKNFNRDEGSAFNYFTTIIVNNLKLLYSKNKKYAEKIARYHEVVTGQTPSSL